MTLLLDRIHASPVVPDRSRGGILLPDVLRYGNYQLWLVLQTGPGRLTRLGVRVPVECSGGDQIITRVNDTGYAHLSDGTAILGEEQVLAVIPKQPNQT